MKANKKVVAACLGAGILLLLLTAFSGVNAWNQEADESASRTAGETTAEAASEAYGQRTGGAETAAALPTEAEDGGQKAAGMPEADGPDKTDDRAAVPAALTDMEAPAEDGTAAGEGTPADETTAAEEVPTGETTAAGEGAPADETTAGEEASANETAAAGEGTSTEDETAEAAASQAAVTTDYFEGQFLTTVTGKTALNVREEPSTDSPWVGKLYAGCGGYVLETGDGWTKIQSGSVTGWVSNDYIVTGEAGREKVLEECELVIEVTSDALKVRSAPTTAEENKIRAIYGKETYPVVSERDGWVEIEYSEGKTGWVTAEYVKIRYSYGNAKSRKEIEEEEAAKKRVNVKKTTRAAQSASVDDTTLLACLIQCESGSYEGQLAVANVILNRVNSSKYPNSISGVIYAAGQFGPVSSGALARRLEKGPSSTALRAATDALNGTNNIGSFVHFRSARGADVDSYSSYTIVAGNCFYKR